MNYPKLSILDQKWDACLPSSQHPEEHMLQGAQGSRRAGAQLPSPWAAQLHLGPQLEDTKTRARREPFLVFGQRRVPAHLGWANHRNPVAWSCTASVSRKPKKAPEHIWGVSWAQEGFQFSQRPEGMEASHLCGRGWAAFFPYQEIRDDHRNSASTRMLGGDRDRVKFRTCFEFWHSWFKQTAPSQPLASSLMPPRYC